MTQDNEMRSVDAILADAWARGLARGKDAADAAFAEHGDTDAAWETPSWLSGEHAGESINELVGDLIRELEESGADDVEDWADEEVCAQYENAADCAFHERMRELTGNAS